MQFLLKNNFSRGFELKASYSLIFSVSHTHITQLSRFSYLVNYHSN